MFKRSIVAALALALVLTTFAFPAGKASAQRTTTAVPGTWLSAILIQNVSASSATVEIKFYDKDGVLKKTYPTAPNTLTLAANKSVTLIVPQDMADLASGQYSAVVSSTAKVVASVQTSSVSQASGPWTAFAYEGVDSANAAKTLFFPAQFKNYYSISSEMVLQNTSDTTSTTLSVTFYTASGSKINATPIDLGTLGPNRAITWAMSDTKFASIPSGNVSGLFGAVVTSSATDIAGISNVWATAPTNKTASYNAFTTGTKTLYAPNLMNNYYGFGSAISLQNVDPANTASGTITYSNGQTQNFSLAPFAAASYYQPANAALPSGNTNGSFTAKVQVTSANGSIVGIVGFSLPPELNGGAAKGDYAYYNCPSTATADVSIPSVLNNYYGLFTAVSVQNTGTQATNITLTYQDGKTWTITNVPANGVANFLHLPKVSGNPYAASTNISTSAVASSSNGQPLVAVIQHNTEASLTAYNPNKRPSDFLHVFTATPKQ